MFFAAPVGVNAQKIYIKEVGHVSSVVNVEYQRLYGQSIAGLPYTSYWEIDLGAPGLTYTTGPNDSRSYFGGQSQWNLIHGGARNSSPGFISWTFLVGDLEFQNQDPHPLGNGYRTYQYDGGFLVHVTGSHHANLPEDVEHYNFQLSLRLPQAAKSDIFLINPGVYDVSVADNSSNPNGYSFGEYSKPRGFWEFSNSLYAILVPTSLTVSYTSLVPEPSAAWTLILGLASLIALVKLKTARRRKQSE